MAGLFLKLYGGIALLILLAGMLVSVHLEGYSRSLSAAEVDKLKILVRLMTANTAVFLPFSVFSSLTVVHERYLFNRLINILSTVAAPCLNLAMLYGGFASVGLVAAGTLLNLISYAAYTIYAGVPPEHPAPVRVALPRSSAGDLCIFRVCFPRQHGGHPLLGDWISSSSAGRWARLQ